MVEAAVRMPATLDTKGDTNGGIVYRRRPNSLSDTPRPIRIAWVLAVGIGVSISMTPMAQRTRMSRTPANDAAGDSPAVSSDSIWPATPTRRAGWPQVSART